MDTEKDLVDLGALPRLQRPFIDVRSQIGWSG